MKRLCRLVGGILAGSVVAVSAWGGHELPVYPSFYPHEIRLTTIAPEAAGGLLRDAKIQAYIGGDVADATAAPIQAVESLGSFVIVQVAPRADACAVAGRAVRAVAASARGLTVHPYPVTPFHGDYLDFADRAEAARARLAEAVPDGPITVVPSDPLAAKLWPSGGVAAREPDARLVTVDAAGLVAHAARPLDGWLGPPWLYTGWYEADLLLGAAVTDADERAHVETLRTRLVSGNFDDLVERINLERALVDELTRSCHVRVVGYTVKRERINVDYNAGIENVGYGAIDGLAAPMFLRTVKLKDFPWNGWLGLGVNGAPTAAWNPIGGMTDRFGRLLWSALGDPAVLPAPGDAGWVLNRTADVRVNQ